jgi:ABC-type spermidine/putrescine transport system permease subunit I
MLLFWAVVVVVVPMLVGILASRETWEACGRSLALGLISALVGVFFAETLAGFSRGKPYLTAIIILPYCVNPVFRVLAQFKLILYIESWLWLPTSVYVASYALPAMAIALNYLPVFLCLNMFREWRGSPMAALSPFEQWIFVWLPVWLKRLPIEFALFFLLAFFDVWVVQLIGDNRLNFWGPLVVHRAFQARDVASASVMVCLGIVITVLIFFVIKMICRLLSRLLLSMSPLAVRRSLRSRHQGWLQPSMRLLQGLILSLVLWPFLYLIIEAIYVYSNAANVEAWRERDRVSSTVILAWIVGVLGSVVGFLLRSSRLTIKRWWVKDLPLQALALAPEASFALPVLFIFQTKILKAGLSAIALSMLSYSIALGYLLWRSFAERKGEAKLRVVFYSMRRRLLKPLWIACLENRRLLVGVAALLFWFSAENVFLVSYLAGPEWQTISPRLLTGAMRGLDPAEVALSCHGFIAVALGLVGPAIWILRPS